MRSAILICIQMFVNASEAILGSGAKVLSGVVCPMMFVSQLGVCLCASTLVWAVLEGMFVSAILCCLIFSVFVSGQQPMLCSAQSGALCLAYVNFRHACLAKTSVVSLIMRLTSRPRPSHRGYTTGGA